MNDEALLNLSKRMKNDFYIGVVGSVRSGKSTFINSFFKLMILPDIKDEFVKQKIVDELPQTALGKQIMTVELKFIPSTTLEVNVDDTVMNIRFVDCVGEIIPSSEGYGSNSEPRLVKTPWFDDAIPFKEAASIGTEKVIYNHSNLGIYVTSDGSFGEFKRSEYQEIEDCLIPKIKDLNKPFVIVLNTLDPKAENALKIANELENKWDIKTIAINAKEMTIDDCNNIMKLALEEFPIADLEINIPDYINVLGDDIEIKKDIDNLINNVESKYNKVKDVQNICSDLRNANIFSEVKLELLEAASGKATIILNLDDIKYNEIVDTLLGDKVKTRADFIEYLYTSKKANSVYLTVSKAIEDATENGYGVSVPRIEDMKLLPPEVVRKNGMYGVKLSAKAPCIHMIAVDLEASFTPIIGSMEQSKMIMDSLNVENNEDSVIWNTEFFGKKLSDIVNDSMKSKVNTISDSSKNKIKNVLDKMMNSDRNNLIAIIL